jgi:flagellar operon protein
VNQITAIQSDILQPGSQTSKSSKKQAFDELLKNEITKNSDVKFSKHAEERLKDRQITLTNQERIMINNAVDKMAQKGAKESLLLLNDMALLVSVKNRTVITALDQSTNNDKVFTNIDSAAILK